MKTPKLIMAMVAVLLFSNLLFSSNPQRGYTLNSADKAISQLSVDINLADSQKSKIRTITSEYETKLQNLDQQANLDTVALKAMNKQLVLECGSKLDSVLTKEQMDILKMKMMQRLQSARN